MQIEGVGWRLWYRDYFDRDSEASLEAGGVGLTEGLKLLWGRVLEEGVLDDGRPTFTWFHLEVLWSIPVTSADGGDIGCNSKYFEIPRDPLLNAELGRLRAWRDREGLIVRLAEAHVERRETGGAEWILAAARESESVGRFLERIV